MLEARRLHVYGKRNTRIVYVRGDNWTPEASPFKKPDSRCENSVSLSPTSQRKFVGRSRKVNAHSTSPRGSPKSGNLFGLAAKRLHLAANEHTPARKPLSNKNVTACASPSIVYTGSRPHAIIGKPRFEPFIDLVDAIVKDGETLQLRDKKFTKARQRLATTANASLTESESLCVRPPQKKAKKRIIVVSDSEDSEEIVQIIPKRVTRGAKANPIVISDDSNHSDDSDYVGSPAKKGSKPIVYSSTEEPSTQVTQNGPPRMQDVPPGSPRAFPITLRNVRASFMEGSPLTPLSITDNSKPFCEKSQLIAEATEDTSHLVAELESSIGALKLAPKAKRKDVKKKPTLEPFRPPEHLTALLAECGQTMPLSFKSFIDSFPSHALTFDIPHGSQFRKIGEASFSEVFAVGDVVLKVIPLRDEPLQASIGTDENEVEYPQESDAKDVLQEVVVTRAMGKICSGFIKLLRAYIVSGEYPPLLLDVWDQFDARNTSENIRPDVFPETQVYALLTLPNGGPDLESYTFPIKTGWRQACSIFWQAAKALASAENLVSFEHRDLHWGQLLVKAVPRVSARSSKSAKHRKDSDPTVLGELGEVQMDHPSHGVKVTIIDLGLARMNDTEAVTVPSKVHWTPLDDTIFEGEGDYQYDVYRMMKEVHYDGDWEKYRPITNVMWLHYLVVKLIRSKRLRSPGSRSATNLSSDSREKQCYDCLMEMEKLLDKSLALARSKKGRGGTKGRFGKAGDVVSFASERGWVK